MSRQVVSSTSIPCSIRLGGVALLRLPGRQDLVEAGCRARRLDMRLDRLDVGRDRRRIAELRQVDDRGEHRVQHAALGLMERPLPAGNGGGHDLAHHRETGSFVGAERPQRTGVVPNEAGRIVGRVAGIVDQAAIGDR